MRFDDQIELVHDRCPLSVVKPLAEEIDEEEMEDEVVECLRPVQEHFEGEEE